MMDADALENPRVQGLMLAAVIKKLDAMDKKFERKVAFLNVETAVSEFLRHLKEGVSRRGKSFRQPRHYEYLMTAFQREFEGKNLAELTAEEVQTFLDRTWGESKASTLRQRQQQLHNFSPGRLNIYLKEARLPFRMSAN
jgi:hypothetical protein